MSTNKLSCKLFLLTWQCYAIFSTPAFCKQPEEVVAIRQCAVEDGSADNIMHLHGGVGESPKYKTQNTRRGRNIHTNTIDSR